MTLIEMINKFGCVPDKFEYPTGEKFELFVRRKTSSRGYIATVCEMRGNVQYNIIWNAGGDTVEEAKEKLKKKILKHG